MTRSKLNDEKVCRNIGYQHDCDKNKKLTRNQTMCGTIQTTLKDKTRRNTKIKFYKIMAARVLTLVKPER